MNGRARPPGGDARPFTQAFAPASCLYRVLAARHRLRPLFLNRTLRYLRDTRPARPLTGAAGHGLEACLTAIAAATGDYTVRASITSDTQTATTGSAAVQLTCEVADSAQLPITLQLEPLVACTLSASSLVQGIWHVTVAIPTPSTPSDLGLTDQPPSKRCRVVALEEYTATLPPGWWRRGRHEQRLLTATGDDAPCRLRLQLCPTATEAVASPATTAVLAGRRQRRQCVIVYQFHHRQWTLQTLVQDLQCPWCVSSIATFPALLTHLRAWHDRFFFAHMFQAEEMCWYIRVMTAEGRADRANPADDDCVAQDDHYQPYFFHRSGRRGKCDPGLRDSEQRLIHQHPAETARILAEKVKHPYQRRFYHSHNMSVKPMQQLLDDSDDEDNHDLLTALAEERVNEYTDVNPSEKALMKLWNGHVLSYPLLLDKQVFELCRLFICQHPESLAGLRNNFVLHLTNLRDSYLLTSEQLQSLLELLELPAADPG